MGVKTDLLMAGAKKLGGMFGKKKPKKVEFKPDTSKVPTSKNISSLISKEQEPFVRRKLQSIKESAARGDVISKSGNVIATPTKERTAKTIMERNPGSYQRRVPEAKGGRIGKKFGGGVKKNSSRMNKLEELGRVDSEKAYSSKGKKNLKAEKTRIVKSLNSRGAAKRGHGAEIK